MTCKKKKIVKMTDNHTRRIDFGERGGKGCGGKPGSGRDNSFHEMGSAWNPVNQL